jgi:hypothetical protein
MVDCTRRGLVGLENIFIYVKTDTNTVLPVLVNDMYVPFTMISRRKIAYYEEDGYKYLIRAYFADSVDEKYNHNTYL